MSAKLPELSKSEYEIMKVIWAQPGSSINIILEQINKKREQAVKRATLQVQLRRLEGKGWLKKAQEGRAYLFTATQKEQTSFLNIALDAKERLFGGSSSKFVRCLFENDKLSREELADLRRLLDEAEEEK